MRTCPLGHTCESCLWNVKIRGTNPSTGQEVDREDCAIAWLPMLLIENSQQQAQTAAAVESTRNAVTESAELLTDAMNTASKIRLLSRTGND